MTDHLSHICLLLCFHRACLVESIYQHSRINTIAPSGQFHGIQISAELMRWLLTTIRHCSKLLATVCHYVFPPFDKIRTFCYSRLFSISLFGFSRHPNKLILFEGLVEGFVPKICFFGQLKTCLKFPVGGLINTLREIRRKYIWNKLKWNSWARLLWELFDEYTAFPVFHLPWSK